MTEDGKKTSAMPLALAAIIVALWVAIFVVFAGFSGAADSHLKSSEIHFRSRAIADNLSGINAALRGYAAGGPQASPQPVLALQNAFRDNINDLMRLAADDTVAQDKLTRLEKEHTEWLDNFLEESQPRTGATARSEADARRLGEQIKVHFSSLRNSVDSLEATFSAKTVEDAQTAARLLSISRVLFGVTALVTILLVAGGAVQLAAKSAEAGGFRQKLDDEMSEHRQTVEYLQRTMEDAKAATQSKNEFLANMSHELRTPLNAIIGFAEILSEKTFGDLNPRQERYVSNILTSGHNLLKLINNILDLAKVESGRIELEFEPLDIAPCIGDVVTHIKVQAISKNIAMNLDMDSSLPLVKADASKIKQILHHLVSNAVKFTPENGKVDIQAHSANGKNDQPVVCISVKDSGIGITEEDQGRVFGEFTQIDSSYGRQQPGTGLGLALTKRYVELHGGRIWVESKGVAGEGSTFMVELPAQIPEIDPQVGEGALEEIIQHGNSLAPMVLVVENEDTARELLTLYLTEAGYQVLHAGDGVQALELARLHRPQAIILDILLPKKDGWDVLTELKSNPDTQGIPVVIVSVSENRELGFSLGAVEYFVKPADREQLVEAVRNAMSRTTMKKRGEFTVLVVDDEPMNVELLIDMLHGLGCKVLLAYGGQQGIDVATSKFPDLIILDLMMPLVTGFDVVRVLREHPQAKHIPILILTSKEITEEDRRILNHQVTAIVPRAGKEALLREMARLGIFRSGS